MEKKGRADKEFAWILCKQADCGTCLIKCCKIDNRQEQGTEEWNRSPLRIGEQELLHDSF